VVQSRLLGQGNRKCQKVPQLWFSSGRSSWFDLPYPTATSAVRPSVCGQAPCSQLIVFSTSLLGTNDCLDNRNPVPPCTGFTCVGLLPSYQLDRQTGLSPRGQAAIPFPLSCSALFPGAKLTFRLQVLDQHASQSLSQTPLCLVLPSKKCEVHWPHGRPASIALQHRTWILVTP
jgi:hypothetical protein